MNWRSEMKDSEDWFYLYVAPTEEELKVRCNCETHRCKDEALAKRLYTMRVKAGMCAELVSIKYGLLRCTLGKKKEE